MTNTELYEEAAAPDMAAWIEKALPLFEDAKTAIDAAYGKGSKLADAIDALLAEAKGGDHAN